MTTLENKKYRLLSATISNSDEDGVFEIERLYSSTEPCSLSKEEIRATVKQRKKDFDNGKIFAMPHEHIRRRVV